jgi:hypothetical protein
MNGRPWTPEAIARLRELYPRTPTKRLARLFKRKAYNVAQAAHRLGIHKDPAFLAAQGRAQAQHPRMVATRFQPGHVPANKGLRRPGWASGRMASTQFKKGGFPPNRDPDFYVIGALRINADGYIDMRVSFEHGAKGWCGLHRILWEDARGPVPPGHIVAFKNGDKLDCELKNLKLLTFAQNMRRNSIHNLPKDLVNTIQVLGQLKRSIREKQIARSA